MADYLEVRCLWPVNQEGTLALALKSAPILGTLVGCVAGNYVELTVYFSEEMQIEATLLGEVLRSSGALGVEMNGVEGRDWLADYRAAARPFAVGDRWWIDPLPDSPTPAPDGRIRLAVEPRSAFGSGTHESTQLVLSLLEEIPVRGQRVLDIGTGSGILAMASAALGARQVVGLDIDPDAAFVAGQTVAQQEISLDVALFAGEIGAVAAGSFDLALCNMISSHFMPIVDHIRGALVPAGRIVLAGFLGSEEKAVRQSMGLSGFHIERVEALGEWSGMSAVIRGQ